jgi:hypothetical protein
MDSSPGAQVVQDLATFLVQSGVGGKREGLERAPRRGLCVDQQNRITQHFHAHDGRGLAQVHEIYILVREGRQVFLHLSALDRVEAILRQNGQIDVRVRRPVAARTRAE